MGKTFLIFSIMMCFCFSVTLIGMAQDKPLKFGARGGLNLANISEDFESVPIDLDDTPIIADFKKSNYTTYGVGGFLEYWLSPAFAVQVNALYSLKGVKAKTDFNLNFVDEGTTIYVNGDLNGTVKMAYFSLPVLAKFAFGDVSAARPYILGGPEVGFLLTAKAIMEAEADISFNGFSTTQSFDEDEDIKDNLESTEFALNFGAGLEFPFSSVRGFIEGRYGLGLTKVNKKTESGEVQDIFGDKEVKNNVIYINVGFIF